VATGGGLITWGKLGKKVGFSRLIVKNKLPSFGAYSQYVLCDGLTGANPIASNISEIDHAIGFGNAMSAVGLIDRCKELKAKAIVMNASFSALGKLVIFLAKKENIPIILIVRKEQ